MKFEEEVVSASPQLFDPLAVDALQVEVQVTFSRRVAFLDHEPRPRRNNDDDHDRKIFLFKPSPPSQP